MSLGSADSTRADLQRPVATGLGLRRGGRAGRLGPGGLAVGAAGLLVLLAVVRVITGVRDVTSSGLINATVTLAVPIALAGLGGLWSERAGVVNIGLEGMMILGTWFGAAFAVATGSPWLAIVGGCVGGLLGGLVHAVATVTFGVDHIVSGVAINILALGAARYLSGVFFTGKAGGGPTQSPRVPQFASLSIPGADGLFGAVERRHWFLVSDLAGVLRGLATNFTWFTVLAVLLVPLSYLILWRTAFGLRLRSVGENPAAAESLGVPVYRMKYVAVLMSGLLAGLGGAFLVLFTSIYREGQTGGRGYIGLAAMIFGNWRPGGLAGGALLFGYADALQLRGGGNAVHALLLFVAIVLGLVAARNLWRRRPVAAGLAALAGLAFAAWYLLTTSVPAEIVFFTPHVTTLLVLALAAQRLRMPAADGLPYRRGQGG